MPVKATNFRLAEVLNASWDNFAGLIDEVALWTRTLSTSEVAELYNGGAGVITPHFSSDWNFIAATLATATNFIDLIYAKNAQPRVRVFLDSTEVSSGLEGKVEISFPEDSAAAFSFGLGGPAYNPFSAAIVNADKDIDIRSVYTDANGTDYETQLFTGLSARIAFGVDAIDITISGLDLTRSVSRDTDKLNREIYAVDAFEEVKLADSTSQVTTTYVIAADVEQPIQGVWLETDTARAINYYIGGSFAGNVITLGSPIPSIQNVVVKYFEGDLNVVTTTRLKKSEIVKKICALAGISSVAFPTQADEDIQSFTYIYANRELPLDIIRKITVPQTWRNEFDEYGVFTCRRSEIKGSPDWTFDESLYDANSFRAEKDTEGVINVQTVLGGIKQQQVLVKAGAAEVFHPYQESLADRRQIGSGNLIKAAAENFHSVSSWTGGPLVSGNPGYSELIETIDVTIPGNYKNISVEATKTTGLYPDSTQVSSQGPYTSIFYERGSYSTSISGSTLTIRIKRLQKITQTNSGTYYSMPALDVSFNVYGKEVQTSEAYTEEAIPPEFETTYYQLGTEVKDITSQSKYGVRKGEIYANAFVETLTQCTRVAEEIIKESNKVWDIAFSIPLNPLLKRGQTVRIQNSAAGIDLTDVAKNVRHYFDLTTGEATTEVSMRAAEYVFKSSLGENQ